MAIQILRNADGNCIEFRGSTNPVYWNACLSGQVDPTYTDRINVINDVATAGAGETVYEFFQLPFTDFRDADNNPFATATDAADYITAQGNVIAQEQGAYQGVWNADTNTPTLSDGDSPTAGDFYFVSVEGTTTLGGVSIWKQNDRIMWSGSAWEKIPARQLTSASTSTTLLSTNTSVIADGEAPTGDPLHQLAGWYYKNTVNSKINWYLYGDTVDLSNTLGDFGGFYMTITFRNQTSAPYWTVYTARENDGEDISWYRSRVNYSDASAFTGVTVDQEYLVYSAGLDVTGVRPDIPGARRISLGTESTTTVGLQASAEELYLMALSTSSGNDAGTEEFIVHEVAYKLGDYFRSLKLSAVPVASAATGSDEVTSIDFQLDPTSTTILADDGKQYGVNSIHANANEDGTINIVALPSEQVIYADLEFGNVTVAGGPAYTSQNAAVNALNALFQVLPLGTGGEYSPVHPTLAGVDITANVNRTVTPTTQTSGGTTHLYGQSGTSDDDIVWSTETIDEAGEYYTVKIAGEGRFIIGLGREEDGDRTELESGDVPTAGGLIWGQAYYDYGLYTAPWTIYGSSPGLSYGPGWSFSSTDQQMRYNTIVQDELNGAGAPGGRDGAVFKIGIADDGYITSWYYDAGRSNDWIMTSRRTTVTEEGNYFLVVKLWDRNNVMVELPLRSATDPTAPILNYRYIESPDGSFHYPLFATEEEANFVDTANGGSGVSHAHVYPDEPTNTTWYMPDTGSSMAVSSAPADTSTITYQEILTDADDAFAPAPLTLSDHTFAENVAVNLQIVPQDVVATVTGLPTYLTYNNGFITGTTTYVPRTLVYPVTVERTNGYGTTTQTFNITISDNASIGEFTGFTRTDGNLVAPNRIVLNNWDALLQYDTVLSEGQELTYSFGAGAVPPTIGILSSEGEARVADFDPAIHTLGAGSHDFADSAKWDLRYVTFGGNLGSTGKYALIGWQDNTAVSGAYPGDQDGGEWKLSYEVDAVHGSNHHLVLYYNGVEKLRSQDHYSGDLTITLAAFDDQQQQDVYVPTNWTIATPGAGSTTPPTGFGDPLLAGTMSSTTLLGDEAAAQLTATLELNHRYIVPQSWIEANVLPHIAGAGANASNDEQFYFGVAKSGTDWSSIDENDFEACFRVEGTSSGNLSRLFNGVGSSSSTVSVGSTTDAYYDYAIEWDGSQLHVIASSLSALTTQPGVNNGGTFSRVLSRNFTGGTNLTLALATRNGAEVNLTTAGLQEVRIPFGANDILLGEDSNGNGNFSTLQPASSLFDTHSSGHAPSTLTYGAPTLNAGYTYRFVYHASMEADDFLEFRLASDNTTVYTTGVTTFGSGDPTFEDNYKGVQFAVPADAPPLRAYFYNGFSSSYDSGRELTISGSTYVTPVTGITLEGPAANQTGSNLFDVGDHGWLSVDEQLGAGERLVMDGAFLGDLALAMPDDSDMYIGLKDGAWADAYGAYFEGGTYLYIARYSASDARIRIHSNGNSSSTFYTTAAGVGSFEAFIELTSSGNNIRIGLQSSSNSSDDASTTAYADWASAYKLQTGDQSYGLTSVDVMVLGSGNLAGNAAGMDSADVDWTGLSEISVPTPASTLTTPWTKALDFAGGSERTVQVTNDSNRVPLRMSGVNNNAAAPAVAGNTSNDANARPWATSIVFKAHTYNDNQHVWNMGEGAGDADDNIYLRRDANRNLWFGWGRTGSELNECYVGYIGGNIGGWWGVYIASNGTRLGSGHTAAEIAAAFDIRMVNLQTGAAGSNLSTATNWTSGSFGARMNRQFTGDMTIGGRGANRSFRGKVAAMVVTTLRRNVAMPTDAEISMMVRDPQQWLTDYHADLRGARHRLDGPRPAAVAHGLQGRERLPSSH